MDPAELGLFASDSGVVQTSNSGHELLLLLPAES